VRPEEWGRTGQHALWGSLSLAQLSMLILGHDGYHTRQIAEWLAHGDAARETSRAPDR